MPPGLFDELLVYFRDGPAIKNMAGGRARNVYRQPNSRRQLKYRIAHGFIEIVQFLSIHSPVKSSADIGAGQPELDVILVIGHCVLAVCKNEGSHHTRGGNVP